MPLTLSPVGSAPNMRTYGLPLVAQMTQFDYERAAVALGQDESKGGLGEFNHLKNIADVLFPDAHWNPWLERMFRSMSRSRWVCWPGCAGAGKTYGAMFFGLLWWLCEPESTRVILTSTTAKALRGRAWAALVKLRRQGQLQETGKFIDSKTMWQAVPGDDLHSILGIAVQSGDLERAIDNIKGVHPKRMLVIIDEATSTPKAIFDACVNLYAAEETEDFRMLVIGNPFSRLDEMGQFAEPANGWESVCVDDEEWETKLKIDGTRGLVTRFDAERCPNVLSGRCDYPHLITLRKLEGLRRGLGDNSPRYWSEVRGFWPPDGLVRTVFTEGELVRQRTAKKWVWQGGDIRVAAGFDPSFGGGDRAVLRFVQWGTVEGGMEGVELGDLIHVDVDARAGEPPNFQMAKRVRQECERRGVTHDRLAVDASGGGRVFCDILEREWGPVIRVESGGKPSERTVSHEDQRKATEAYDRRVTELWYQARELQMSGQLRGLDAETAVEFCSRRYDDEKRKVVLETKDEYKKRHGRSPDLADAVVFALEAARQLGLTIRSVGSTLRRYTVEKDEQKAAHDIYRDVNYSGDNEAAMLDFYEGAQVL